MYTQTHIALRGGGSSHLLLVVAVALAVLAVHAAHVLLGRLVLLVPLLLDVLLRLGHRPPELLALRLGVPEQKGEDIGLTLQ